MVRVYEATAYVEGCGWMVHAVDIGRSVRVGTLGEAEEAAKILYAAHLACGRDEEIAVVVTAYRTSACALACRAWRRMTRCRAV